MESSKPRSCSPRTREVKLVQLFRGEDPMLVKMDTDELISL